MTMSAKIISKLESMLVCCAARMDGSGGGGEGYALAGGGGASGIGVGFVTLPLASALAPSLFRKGCLGSKAGFSGSGIEGSVACGAGSGAR